jgi:flagellar motor protein MotB
MFARSTPAAQGEESKDIFAPVADLMVGVVFIFIILMLALVMNLQREDTVARSEYDQQVARVRMLEARNAELAQRLEQETRLRVAAQARERALAEANERLVAFARFVRDSNVMRLMARLSSADLTRERLLEEMRGRLAAANIEVTVDSGLGTLMLPARRLFDPGRAEPTADGRATILQLGQVMADVLPCYSFAPGQETQRCGTADEVSRLNAVYIEGHTDVTPFSAPGARFSDNWDLSAGRAIAAFKLVGDQFEQLRNLRNRDGDALLGVSGYADTRPANRAVTDRRLPEVLDKDRRIEVRVIMTTNEELVGSVLQELDNRLRQISDLTSR